MANLKYKPLQIWKEDKELLDKVVKKTRLDIVDLMHDAIQWLKKKHRIKEDEQGVASERTNKNI